jgi:hypothetical protein
MNLNSTVKNYFANPAITAAITTGVAYASKLTAPFKYNPFTATLSATALLAGVGALANSVAQKALGKTQLTSAVATFVGIGAVKWLNNNYLVKYLPSLGLITTKGALAIAAVVLAVKHARDVRCPAAAKAKSSTLAPASPLPVASPVNQSVVSPKPVKAEASVVVADAQAAPAAEAVVAEL